MNIIPYNHLMVYQNYYNNNKFNKRNSILKQFKEMLSFFCHKYIYDNYSSNKI